MPSFVPLRCCRVLALLAVVAAVAPGLSAAAMPGATGAAVESAEDRAARLAQLTRQGGEFAFYGEQAEAQARYAEAARNGYSPAMFALAKLLERNPASSEALQWYRNAAAAGHPDARATLLWRELQQGNADGAGLAALVMQLQDLDQGGSAAAAHFIGRLHERGGLLPRDETLAAESHERAARRGLAEAQLELAQRYRDGRGVALHTGMAAMWMDEAARQGLPAAQRLLGLMFREGWGVERDEPEALFWLERAAVQGDVPAMTALALLHVQGRETRPDAALARQWLRRAAQSGDVNAQFELGRLQLEGRIAEAPAPAARAEALLWLQAAARAGLPAATQYLNEHQIKEQTP